MGGRLDATNVLEAPLLSVITGIALDHTAYLGDTVEAIAREKAGILRPGTPAVSGALDEGVRAVLREEAAAHGTGIAFSDLRELRDVRPSRYGTDFSYRERVGLHIPFAASYQPKNAALVLDACDANIFIPYANDFRNALNAAGAAAVLGFEVNRQRNYAGSKLKQKEEF